jgi:hypothetical protein
MHWLALASTDRHKFQGSMQLVQLSALTSALPDLLAGDSQQRWLGQGSSSRCHSPGGFAVHAGHQRAGGCMKLAPD